jgi:hypothetical protein
LSHQLDILALEPFYGGVRRVMLDAMIHCSRHRWTLLKLPPRRIERRLTAASIWFAEQLTRHWAGRTDILFTSEALNLADLYRLMPALLKKPSVVYFHSNQLPDVLSTGSDPLDLVNLNTAAAATEIWFNSLFHLRSFLARATALVNRHAELAGRNPLPDLTAKAQIMPPPLNTNLVQEVAQSGPRPRRERRTIFLETRDADIGLLNRALQMLQRRNEKFQLITIGPVEDLHPDVPRFTISENDEAGHVRAMFQSGLFVSAKPTAPADHQAVKALLCGCWPVVPHSGVYRELIPEVLHRQCLYEGTPDALVNRIQDAWHAGRIEAYADELVRILKRFDPIVACKAMDERLDELVVAHSLNRELGGK